MVDEIINKVNNEKEQDTMILDNIVSFLSKFFSRKEVSPKVEDENKLLENDIKKSGTFMVWKEANGQYRWFATYSNAFRDNDFPPEIVSKSSHQRFVNLVDTKQTPMPELWHWHIKNTKYGVADWVAFDEDTGFAMAMGYILPGHEKEAESMADSDIELGVSHGMPTSSIKYDKNDKSIINEHITVEISDLPMFAAANKLTNFTLFKESDDMTIPDVKKEYLRKVGLTDEKIAEIDEKNKSLAEGAIDAGIETKGSDEKIDEKTENKEVVTPVEKVEPVLTFVTKEEVASTLADVLKELTASFEKINESVANLSTRLDQFEKSSQEKSNELSATPTASLAAMIAKNLSAVGSKETQIRKDSPLTKETPLEYIQKNEKASGADFMSDIIQNIISGKK